MSSPDAKPDRHEAWRDPDPTPDELRRVGYEVVDMIADYFDDIREAPISPAGGPSEVARLFDEPPPERGEAPDAILDAWREKVLPNATRVGSPRYFGYVMGSSSMMGVFAEALAASVNMNVGAWKPAPAATEIERRTIRWLSELIGYGADVGGLFLSGGTMANVSAVQTALRNGTPYDAVAWGLQDADRPGRFRIYMADHEAHVSFVRAVDMLNLGRDAIRRVPGRDDFTMDVAALERMIDEDIAAGDIPFCVVGHVGSINIGAIDPLDEIADVCEARGIWFHADGANGAVAAMLPEMRTHYRGLERADSVTLDPHKWLGVPYECGCLLVRDPERLRRTFSIGAPYLRGILPEDDPELDYLEYGPQMSRGFRALKVWMALRHYGAEGFRAFIRQGIRCARHLDRLVRADDDFETLHEPIIFVYSFRYAPPSLRDRADAGERLDELNQRIADALRDGGTAFVMTSGVNGRTVLRLSICSHRTTPPDIEAVFEEIRALGRAFADADDDATAQAVPAGAGAAR